MLKIQITNPYTQKIKASYPLFHVDNGKKKAIN